MIMGHLTTPGVTRSSRSAQSFCTYAMVSNSDAPHGRCFRPTEIGVNIVFSFLKHVVTDVSLLYFFDPFQKWGFCPLFSSASSDSDARPARLPREILLFLRSRVHPEDRRGTAGKLGGLGGLDSKAPQPGFSCYLRSQVMTSLGP